MTLPFLFPFICVLHSNSDTLFISTGALVSHTFLSFISFMSHCLYHLLVLFRCCELSLPISLLRLGLNLSIACAILSLAYSNDVCQSDNFCLGPSNPILALFSFGKVGGDLNLFYTLEEGHSPSKSVYNIRSDPVISHNIF